MNRLLKYVLGIGITLFIWQCGIFKEPGAAVMSTTLPNPEIEEKEEQELLDADFNLVVKDLSGQLVKMEDYKGKVIFLNFWATWCMPCVAELPSIEKLFHEFKGDVVFLLVSNENLDKVAVYRNKKGFTVPFHILDGDGHLPNLFYYESIPTTHIINKEGKIVKSSAGAEDWDDDEFIKQLREML